MDHTDSCNIPLKRCFETHWPPARPIDEAFYDIQMSDGEIALRVEFWAFGGGFEPLDKNGVSGRLVRYRLDGVASFQRSGAIS